MSEFKNLKLEVADEIAVLSISRPAALNALNSETLDELNVCLSEIEARDDVKVLILTVHEEVEYLVKAIDLGVEGYILKDSNGLYLTSKESE